ncbi:MAG: type II toxin-antitoxin system Phd/YefM family antitoxin [Alphaproteobacteria bacterium]|nr:type II toxin-antitoxin system Phd/YefM family antitoxin [Alphaproteobacteria bacterium]
MKTAASTNVQNNFGEFLEAAGHEPIAVTRTGRKVAVLLSWSEYERLTHLEETALLARVMEAEAEGYLGTDTTASYLKSKLAGVLIEKSGVAYYPPFIQNLVRETSVCLTVSRAKREFGIMPWSLKLLRLTLQLINWIGPFGFFLIIAPMWQRSR